jgi:hypothetical protein
VASDQVPQLEHEYTAAVVEMVAGLVQQVPRYLMWNVSEHEVPHVGDSVPVSAMVSVLAAE